MATQNAADTQNPVQVARGGTGVATNTAYAVLCGGTVSTGAVQSVASVGSTGQVLKSNGAGALPTFQGLIGGTPTVGDIPIYNMAGQLVAMDLSKFALMFDDLEYYGTLSAITQLWPWERTLTGGGTSIANLVCEQGHLGIMFCAVGDSSSTAVFNRGAGIDIGDDTVRFEALVRFPDLSTGSQEYECNIGIHNGRTAGVPASTGIYFEYDRTNSVNWRGVCANGGSITRSSGTNVAVSAGSWHHLVFVLNEAGTSVSFTVDGTDIGSVTADIPASMDAISVMMLKTVGNTVVRVDTDFIKVFIEFGTDRY